MSAGEEGGLGHAVTVAGNGGSAVAAMAGDKELPGACDKAIQTTKREIN